MADLFALLFWMFGAVPPEAPDQQPETMRPMGGGIPVRPPGAE